MINGLIPIGRIVLIAVIVSGCSDWPSDSDALQTRFSENKEAFEKLATMIRDSDYLSVATMKGSDKLFVNRAESFQMEVESSEQALVLVSLLRQTNTHTLIRPYEPDGTVLFTQYSKTFEINTASFVGFQRGADYPVPLIECSPEFRDLSCGFCGWHMDEDWSLVYQWKPLTILPAENEEFLSGEMSLDDYVAMESDSIQQCEAEGYIAIGYDVSKIQKLE
jgi:hypothetical protein